MAQERLLSIDALRGFDMFWVVGGVAIAWILTECRPLADDSAPRGRYRSRMNTTLKLAITLLALAAAACAGDPMTSAAGGATLAVDAAFVRTFSGDPVTSGPQLAPVTGRDWNCPRCYK